MQCVLYVGEVCGVVVCECEVVWEVFEQFQVEYVFEVVYLLCDGVLCDVDFVGGGVEIEVLCGYFECMKCIQWWQVGRVWWYCQIVEKLLVGGRNIGLIVGIDVFILLLWCVEWWLCGGRIEMRSGL